MRLITGDELGLLKEIIPELCRRPPTDASGHPISTPSWLSTSSQCRRPRPSATTIQAMANSYGDSGKATEALGGAVQRLENGDGVMQRQRGVLALSFIKNTNPSGDGADDDDGGDSTFQFAALRINGTVEKWSASRVAVGYDSNPKNSEANVTPARYHIVSSCQNVFGDDKTKSEHEGEEDDDGDAVTGKSSNKGWYCNPPVRPIGMVSTTANDGSKPLLAAADSAGNISILDDSCKVVTRYHAYSDPSDTLQKSTANIESKDGAVLTYTKGRFSNNHIATCIGVAGDRLAVGGRERGVRVLDLETGKGIWKAKNLPPDPQTLLQQPIWTTALQFIRSPHSNANNADQNNNPSHTNLLATGTAYKQVQIYDVRSSSSASTDSAQGITRRPILHTPEHLLQHRVTSLLQLPNSNHLLVADSVGDAHVLDMRKFHSGKQSSYKKQKQSHSCQEIGIGRLVGPGGSIRQLALHPTLPLVACVGLDRKLWTWDINSRRMVDCIYLRQRLNCLLMCEDEGWNAGGDEQEEEGIVGDGRDWDDADNGDEDEVEDYIDSEEEDVEGNNESNEDRVNRADNDSDSSAEGTTSESDDDEESLSEIGMEQVNGSTSEEDEEQDEVMSQQKKKRKVNKNRN
ncbi:hypothetical protein HJC23_009230 [Cyclotella cryptica]|uniref:Uncharacterized protein n=1 Tax=Cyclotella cryptica TaxID=29204 RepID=A0ABD3Q675_9STRA|eukprot:CCRYP_008490-RA/>CCRYP_008490-RA protein AED:0.15 eAED:0.15 QI:163/1/1/1/1/1/2/120/629